MDGPDIQGLSANAALHRDIPDTSTAAFSQVGT
jgi:hypothetical protein